MHAGGADELQVGPQELGSKLHRSKFEDIGHGPQKQGAKDAR